MKKSKKMLRNLALFIILIFITFSIVFKNEDISEVWKIVLASDKKYFLAGVIAMFLYFFLEAINIDSVLQTLGQRLSIWRGTKYTLLGFFFSAITPASTGGQPMEIYYMHKEGISVSDGTVALLIELCCYQIVTIILGIIGAVLHFSLIKNGLLFLFLLGTFLCGCALFIMLVGLFSKTLTSKLINFSIRVMKFFKIKNIEEKELKIRGELNKYHSSSEYIKSHKFLFVKSIFIVLIQMICLYSVTYFVYRALGFNDYSLVEIILIQSMFHSTVSSIPLPGTIGISEFVFMKMFKNIFSENVVGSAMLLSRGISFYFTFIVSAIFLIVHSIKNHIIFPDDEDVERITLLGE
ncbi:MAG: flippase-like domain-containing protein [Clostridia bacterium]|nr:flippase-like domain-containing protein [Clostridia bacterium]